ncbi:MAG: MarR family transcriptional regulator [Pseudomonadota bacterium]
MTDPYPLSNNLGYLLNRCGALMAARFERELSAFDVTLAQWGALLVISSAKGASPSQIAAGIGIDRGATTRLIARMEAKGLITREDDKDDARSVVLRLTPQAEALMPQLIARSRKVNQDALARLDPESAGMLLPSLSQLLERLRNSD